MSNFWFKQFNVVNVLPYDWQQQILKVADLEASYKILISSSITSREYSQTEKVPVLTVGGKKVKELLPWLYELYVGEFRRIAESFLADEVFIANDDRYAINLNIQKGSSMRYECHVDSNPLEGLLFVTDHPRGSGGELVVSNNCDARGPLQISTDSIEIYPKAGMLTFFDARNHPHFVRPLTGSGKIRVVVAMNYYTPNFPESMRPSDLNKHLGIE